MNPYEVNPFGTPFEECDHYTQDRLNWYNVREGDIIQIRLYSKGRLIKGKREIVKKTNLSFDGSLVLETNTELVFEFNSEGWVLAKIHPRK